MQQKRTIYFLGIGGIGMSALARYFMHASDEVCGYDLTPSPLIDQLVAEGAHVHFTEDVSQIPDKVDFVVYTPAVSKQHAEYQFFAENNIPIYKRSQVLGIITKGKHTLAVAGTHGKTTTTSMLAQIFHAAMPVTAFIGGIAKNFDSNLVLSSNPEAFIVEADEFDRSFLTLYPSIAVITSMDADHLDIYGEKKNLEASFQQFADQVDRDGAVVVCEKVAAKISHPHKMVYGFEPSADFYAHRIQQWPHKAAFDILCPDGICRHVELGVSGMHNVLNATAAFAVAYLSHLPDDVISAQLSQFSGVKRRFDFQVVNDQAVYIDDYAHHPEEIKAFLKAVRQIYPDKQLTGIFQPHLFSRTRDFAPQFAEALALLDKVILLNIYPAREKPIPGITSQYLLDMIPVADKVLVEDAQLLDYLKVHRPEVLLTIGAGNIDRFVPKIKALFENLR